MFYVPRPQSYYYPTPRQQQPEYYPYSFASRRPAATWYDDDDDYEDNHDYVEARRREYLNALHQQQLRREYDRAVELENRRHRAQLAALAEREALRQDSFPVGLSRTQRGYEHPAREEPPRRRQPATRPARQPQGYPRLSDDWKARMMEELYGIPAAYIRQYEKESSDEEEIPGLEEEQQPEPQPASRAAKPHRVPAAKPSKPQPATALQPQQQQPPAAPSIHRVPITTPPTSDSESDAPKRAESLATIASIAHTFDTLRQTFTFPSGPLERNPHTSTPQLAYNAQNSVVHAYDNALAELLTKLDAVESHGSRAIRDARRELVVRIEKELGDLEKKVRKALGMEEEEKKEGEEIHAEDVEDVQMTDESPAPAAASEPAPVPPIGAVQPPAAEDEHMANHEPSVSSIASLPTNETSQALVEPQQQPADQPSAKPQPELVSITEPTLIPIDELETVPETTLQSSLPVIEEPLSSTSLPPTLDAGDAQYEDTKWTPECPPIEVEPSEGDPVSESSSEVPELPHEEGSDREFEML